MRRILAILPCAMLAACVARAPAPAVPAALQAPPEFPLDVYRDAQARGQEVLQVDTRHSHVAIEVRRGGPLAGLGHDHVVASRNVQGYVLPGTGRADLFIPLAQLTVDEAGLREESGMGKPPSADAVEGTRRNMLDKVLEAERFPFALVHIVRRDKDPLHVSITLHGRTQEFSSPAHIEQAAGKMTVSGELTIAQSDFGIAPFAVLGGALQVQDTLTLRYRIVAAQP
ncbi:YceI family protein [Noviherbaspirillum sp. ST9]|uniref:YceI family protein n=1 Tax=Noviherbaspirillum sp. ST9 TaxID=3401606 RepID=UPI003B587310